MQKPFKNNMELFKLSKYMNLSRVSVIQDLEDMIMYVQVDKTSMQVVPSHQLSCGVYIHVHVCVELGIPTTQSVACVYSSCK